MSLEPNRTKFIKELYSIKVGMSKKQVTEIMSNYYIGTGWILPPEVRKRNTSNNSGKMDIIGFGEVAKRVNSSSEMEIQNSVVYRHDLIGEYDSDWGVITFDSDFKVRRIQFHPD